MYTLAVIDMQERFVDPYQTRVVQNCLREIEQAKLDLAPILLIEYNGCGPTVAALQQAVVTHPRVYRVTKTGDNGAAEIAKELRSLGLSHQPLKIVGVNTDCCVYSTVRGLTAELPGTTLDVVADACDSSWNHMAGLELIRGLGCVRLS